MERRQKEGRGEKRRKGKTKIKKDQVVETEYTYDEERKTTHPHTYSTCFRLISTTSTALFFSLSA